MRSLTALFVFWSMTVSVIAQNTVSLVKQFPTQCNEPSDIVFYDHNIWVLGDKAFLYQMDETGKVKPTGLSDFDLEGIASDGKYLYISEETYQRILIWDPKQNKLKGEVPFRHGGGRNEGVESLIYLPSQEQFILATEKDPNIFFLTDKSFSVQEQFTIKGISEVSGMTYYQDKWYILSDEASTLFLVNLETRSIDNSWVLPVINPEGVAFDTLGQAWICADDMKKIFIFKLN